MQDHMTPRVACRVCYGKLKKVFGLGNLAMNGFPEKKDAKLLHVHLTLSKCVDCGLLQLLHTAPFEKMYVEHYWYKSGISPVIVNDLQDIVNKGIKEAGVMNGVWIDIGANDGTLLSKVPDEWVTYGVEPAKNLTKELEQNCSEAVVDFWESTRVQLADVITAVGMFYDSEDPNAFVSNVKAHLKRSGVFIAQLMTLEPMLKNADVGNICHEHVSFFSYKSLKRLFEQNGLEIYKVELNGINGGSYRLFARHFRKGSIDFKEPTPNYRAFVKKIQENKRKTVNFLKKCKKEGKKVYAYGASTKGNLILEYYGVDSSLVLGAADCNIEKHGKFMGETGIPIVSEEEARAKADVFWVLPYGFLDHFLKKEKAWGKKGTFLVCMPEFKTL